MFLRYVLILATIFNMTNLSSFAAGAADSNLTLKKADFLAATSFGD